MTPPRQRSEDELRAAITAIRDGCGPLFAGDPEADYRFTACVDDLSDAIDELLALRQRPALSAEAQRGLAIVKRVLVNKMRFSEQDEPDPEIEELRAFLDAVTPEEK